MGKRKSKQIYEIIYMGKDNGEVVINTNVPTIEEIKTLNRLGITRNIVFLEDCESMEILTYQPKNKEMELALKKIRKKYLLKPLGRLRDPFSKTTNKIIFSSINGTALVSMTEKTILSKANIEYYTGASIYEGLAFEFLTDNKYNNRGKIISEICNIEIKGRDDLLVMYAGDNIVINLISTGHEHQYDDNRRKASERGQYLKYGFKYCEVKYFGKIENGKDVQDYLKVLIEEINKISKKQYKVPSLEKCEKYLKIQEMKNFYNSSKKNRKEFFERFVKTEYDSSIKYPEDSFGYVCNFLETNASDSERNIY